MELDAQLRAHAENIVVGAIRAVLPDEAVRRVLQGKAFPGRVRLVAVGKAAWQMAKTATDVLKVPVDKGIVITKYQHIKDPIPGIVCREAGHPVPDENTFSATEEALEMVADLREEDTVLFLLSGGGSALFEKPLVSGEELQDITGQLLACGADIVEINTIRKRLSRVKGGRFAQLCAPAQVFAIVLSDILGDPLDMIASGPVCPDSTTSAEAIAVAEKYKLRLSERTWELLKQETPKELFNATTQITGSVKQLCSAAERICRELGYEPAILTDRLCCEAKEAGRRLAENIKQYVGTGKNIALIAGGETVVKVTGNGLGGRNQELALAAAEGIANIPGAAVFSVGSDGTDGPTDAAGGYVDYQTVDALRAKGIDVNKILQDNDSYHALKRVGGLVITGPTGTNVNDVAVALLRQGE